MPVMLCNSQDRHWSTALDLALLYRRCRLLPYHDKRTCQDHVQESGLDAPVEQGC